MKVAALYDVHGMPWALAAVLAELEHESGVDAVVFGGDLVAGPFPVETLALSRSVANASYVRGNAEREPDDRVAALLGDDEVAAQREWPMQVKLDDVLYCHATPASDEEIVTDASPDTKIDQLLDGIAERLVVGGHTHMQQRRGKYVNAGSVGMPYEGEVAAFWLIVDDGEPAFRKTTFDVEAAVALLQKSDWPAAQAFVDDNLRAGVARAEAIAVFGG